METVTRIFSPDVGREAPVIETGITKDRLLGENQDHEAFAELVWETCDHAGFYNDSDLSSDLLCVYVKGGDEKTIRHEDSLDAAILRLGDELREKKLRTMLTAAETRFVYELDKAVTRAAVFARHPEGVDG